MTASCHHRFPVLSAPWSPPRVRGPATTRPNKCLGVRPSRAPYPCIFARTFRRLCVHASIEIDVDGRGIPEDGAAKRERGDWHPAAERFWLRRIGASRARVESAIKTTKWECLYREEGKAEQALEGLRRAAPWLGETALRTALRKSPGLLARSPATYADVAAVLEEMVPNADLEKVMLRHPVVFLASPDRLRRALSVFPPAGRGRVLRAAPSALTRSEETLRAKVRSVGEVLRLDSYSAAMTVVLREPRVLHCEPTTLQRNAQRLTQTVNALWGGRGGSPDRVCAAIAKCPSLLYQNSSTLIDVKLPCLCKTTQEYLGLSGVGDMLVAAPGLWRSRIRATTAPKFLLLAEACNARGMVRWRTWLRDPGSAGSIGRVLSGSKARVARLLFCAENDNPSLCAWAARQSPGTLAVKYTDAQFFAVLAKHGVSESDFKRQWVGRYRDRHREPPGVPDDAAGRRADGELKKLSQGLKLVLEARGLAGEVVHGLDSPDEVDDGQQQPPV